MLLRRSLVPLAVLVGLSGCASLSSHPAAVPASEITLDLSASPAIVREQLVRAFAEQGLPVATSQPGVVEFHGARERGILGFDDVFARAVIVPLDCGARVTLFGEETHYANASVAQGAAVRIGPSSSGRARDVWTKLESVAAALRGNAGVTSRIHSD